MLSPSTTRTMLFQWFGPFVLVCRQALQRMHNEETDPRHYCLPRSRAIPRLLDSDLVGSQVWISARSLRTVGIKRLENTVIVVCEFPCLGAPPPEVKGGAALLLPKCGRVMRSDIAAICLVDWHGSRVLKLGIGRYIENPWWGC